MRIITLSENSGNRKGLLGEWGLSFLIENGDSKILFDCGQTISAAYNAKILDINLGEVDRIILSHGHYDHTGGLKSILKNTRKNIQVIAHPDIFDAKYARRNNVDEYIGIPYRREELESQGAEFLFNKRTVRNCSGVTTTGQIPMISDFEEIDKDFFIKKESGWQPDNLLDDQALIIQDRNGLAVICGCAHRGLINTINHAKKLTGSRRIHTVIGGSHLLHASEKRLRQTIDALKEVNVQRLGLCHCTGVITLGLLAKEFQERFFLNNSGTIVNI